MNSHRIIFAVLGFVWVPLLAAGCDSASATAAPGGGRWEYIIFQSRDLPGGTTAAFYLTPGERLFFETDGLAALAKHLKAPVGGGGKPEEATMVDILNHLGAQGWEVASSSEDCFFRDWGSDRMKFYTWTLKRPKA